jgi:hypothetical protein
MLLRESCALVTVATLLCLGRAEAAGARIQIIDRKDTDH